jgi:hypothetical protein
MSWPEVVLALGVLGALTTAYAFRVRALDAKRLDFLESRLRDCEAKLSGSGLTAPRPIPVAMRGGRPG